jgi:nicotinamidase-related amidase
MANVIFWDADTQHDFMLPDGRLYVPNAEHLAPNLKHLTEHAHAEDILILATACDHSLDDAEISSTPDLERTFPPHCLRHTTGSRKIPATNLRQPVVIETEVMNPSSLRALVEDHDGEVLVKKQHFDAFTNPNVAGVLDALAPDHVVIYGVALESSARAAIDGLLDRGVTVHLVTDAVQAMRPEAAPALLEAWGRRGVRMTSTAEIVEGGYLSRLR